jgi:hypothetical protein
MGSVARDLLAQEHDASILGVTSLGSFLRLSSPWVVFLSRESYRGPLTLNLDEDSDDLERLAPGSSAKISPDCILFPAYNLVINTWQSRTWEVPAVPEGFLPPAQRQARLADVARKALAGKSPSRLSLLLSVLLGWEAEASASENLFTPFVQALGRSLEGSDVPAIAESIEALLGLGTGLTPSGDDLVLGLLLALNRWGNALSPTLDIHALNQAVLPHAYRKTTLLAANLIECASRGQANERLLLALDGIVSGAPDVTTCAAHLASWGNSSGLDALVGMALVLIL